MPRKKSEFKPLTYKKITKINPKRKNLSGNKQKFIEFLQKSIKNEAFDKRKP